jgi:hypothetical protein
VQAADTEFDDDATFLIAGPVPAEGRALVVMGARSGVVTLARLQLTRDGLK